MFYVLAIRNIIYFVAYEECRYVVVCSYDIEIEASRLGRLVECNYWYELMCDSM